MSGITGPTGATGQSNNIVYNVSAGSGVYVINGANNPTLNLIRGLRYTFSVNTSGHPFWIQTTSSIYSGAYV